jgi:hypothetical protein
MAWLLAFVALACFTSMLVALLVGIKQASVSFGLGGQGHPDEVSLSFRTKPLEAKIVTGSAPTVSRSIRRTDRQVDVCVRAKPGHTFRITVAGLAMSRSPKSLKKPSLTVAALSILHDISRS